MIYIEKGIKEEVEERESRKLEDRSGSCFWGVVPPLSTLKLRKDLHSNIVKVVDFMATLARAGWLLSLPLKGNQDREYQSGFDQLCVPLSPLGLLIIYFIY